MLRQCAAAQSCLGHSQRQLRRPAGSCGSVTVSFVGDSASNGTSSCNNTITRTYKATDACGNSAACAQTILINDSTPPSITCPAGVTVQCFANVPPPNPASVTASDNCDDRPAAAAA